MTQLTNQAVSKQSRLDALVRELQAALEKKEEAQTKQNTKQDSKLRHFQVQVEEQSVSHDDALKTEIQQLKVKLSDKEVELISARLALNENEGIISAL